MGIRITEREEEIFKIISKSGAISRKMLTEDYNMDRRRIDKLTKEGYFERHHDTEKEGKKHKNRYSYSFGEVGKEYAMEQGYCFRTQGYNGYQHNLKVEKEVKKLIIEKEIEVNKILNEKEQEVVFRDEIKQAEEEKIDFRVNDLAYWDNEGKLHSLEIENNYGKKLINQHKRYAEKVLGVKYEFTK